MEQVLVTWDWTEAFVALNLIAKPAIEEAVLRQLGDTARHQGDMLLGMLTDAQLVDADRAHELRHRTRTAPMADHPHAQAGVA